MVRARVFDVRGVITVEYEMLKNDRELGLKHQQTLATAGAAMTDWTQQIFWGLLN